MPEDEGVSPQDRINVAYGAVRQLLLAIGLGQNDIPKEFHGFIEKAIRLTLAQHGEHLVQHGVDQKHVDPYKLVSWLGCAILAQIPCEGENSDGKKCPFRVVARATLMTLCGFLKFDSKNKVELPVRTRKLLQKMLVAEKIGNHEHGIWQNGLYVGFHCAVASLPADR